MQEPVKNFDVVALLADVPEAKLARGQVGTVVETLANNNLLVEFSDDEGKTYALAPIAANQILVLHYEPKAA